MLTITLEPALEARLRAAAARGEDPNTYAVAVLSAAMDKDTRLAGQELLGGAAHPFDPDAVRRKHSLPDRTPEQISEDAEQALAALSPETQAAMEQEGLLGSDRMETQTTSASPAMPFGKRSGRKPIANR